MGIEEKLLIIRRNDFLAQLSPADYTMLNIEHNFIEVGKNDYIYFDAHLHNKIYFVKEGHVKIGTVDDAGNEIIKDIILPGDIFGQFTLEKSNNLLGEFAQAYKTDVSLCAFTVDDFETLLTKRPGMAISFSKKVGQRLQKAEYRLVNLLQRDVRTRLLHFLWSLTKKEETEGIMVIDNFLTHEDMARLIGASRQTVTTMLKALEKEGLLEVERKRILLLKPGKIQQLVNVV